MNPFSYLQNAIVLAAALGIYFWAGTAWGFLLLAFWLSPSGKCECEEEPKPEPKRVITP